jgi:hypothetical protein
MTKDSSNLPGALERSHDETRSAFENRALMYAYIHDELVKELGPEPARELMKRAGRVNHTAAAAGDLAEVARLFCEGSPCGGSLFEPGIDEEADEGRVVLRMTACPLVDAWKAAGYGPEAVDRLCEIAAAVDEGTFEGAGLRLRFLQRAAQPEGDRCLLELRLPASSASAFE